MAAAALPHPSSYRDPSGFVFSYNGEFYRQINTIFKTEWEAFVQSGLHAQLVAGGLLIDSVAINENLTGAVDWYQTLKPEQLGVVTYPYEWSFGMLKDAALLTLDLAVKSLENGFILKDASAYNVQLHKGRMTFIDTLSFVPYVDGEPWVAYRQFCEQFLAPLALSHYTHLPCSRLLLSFPDGVSLSYASKLLPFRSKLNVQLYLHLHLHAKQSPSNNTQASKVQLPKAKLLNVLQSLRQTVLGLNLNEQTTVWGEYYNEAAHRQGYLEEKKQVTKDWLNLLSYNTAIDVGGNTGEFSKLAWGPGQRVICADGEHEAIENLYQSVVKKEGYAGLTPMVIDFAAPSPAIGLNNKERMSFLQRAKSDLVLALAVMHHLAIGRNVPFERIAELFLELGKLLVIEWIPKEDDKVKLLLQHKKDVYQWYSQESFLSAFEQYFIVEKNHRFQAGRTLYLMKAK